MWLIVIAAACCTFVGIAAYTEVSSVKRVVSTQAAPGNPFSSNCMNKDLASYHMTASEFQVSVCNFDQKYPDKYSQLDISYILEAELQIKMGANDYKPMQEIKAEYDVLSEKVDRTDEEQELFALYGGYITKAANYFIEKTGNDTSEPDTGNDAGIRSFTAANGYKVTFGTNGAPQKLKKKVSSTDYFKVTIDSADVRTVKEPLFFVQVTAHPISGVNEELKVRLYGSAEKGEAEAKWVGSISDAGYTPSNYAQYDFYNYVITGSGKGSVDILWNENELYINKFFLEENGLNITAVGSDNEKYGENFAGWKMVTLENVDSVQKNRYEMQLFKTESFSRAPSDSIMCFFNEAPKTAENGQSQGQQGE